MAEPNSEERPDERAQEQLGVDPTPSFEPSFSSSDPPAESTPADDPPPDNIGGDRQPSQPVEKLGREGGVSFWLSVTTTPWHLGVDTMVVSAAIDGPGYLGSALFDLLPPLKELAAPSLADLRPASPVLIAVPPPSADVPSPVADLQNIILVSVYPSSGTSTSKGSPDSASAAQAARASVVLAIGQGARRLGLPLLGTGLAGLAATDVAERLVPAVRSTVTSRQSSLTDVYFVVNEAAAGDAIRAAWIGYRTQPLANDQATGEDLLNIREEVQALADMILLRQVQPPLAVGILGGWGSGKSFVMHLMRERIDAIRAQSLRPDETWEGGHQSPFVGHVYPINFNAWTYARADLWAALMQRVLSELDQQIGIERRLLARRSTLLDGDEWKRLFELPEDMQALYEATDTSTTKDLFSTLEAVHVEDRRKLVEKQAQLATLRAEEVIRQRDIEADVESEVTVEVTRGRWKPFLKLAGDAVHASADDVAKWIAKLPNGKEAMEDGTKTAENAKVLESALRVLRPPDRKMARTVLGAHWFAALVFVAGAVVTPFLLARFHDSLDLKTVPAAVVSAMAAIGAFARLARSWTDTARRFADHILDWRRQVDVEIERVEQTRSDLVTVRVLENKGLQETREKIRTTEQEVSRLRDRAELVGQFDSVGSVVAARLEAGTYRERLGVMQDISDDLRSLSRSLTISPRDIHAREKREAFPRGPARVVLFIDDLDRCPPDKVVEVLEAVQLLLATDLFVVVIALDVRYVTRALEKVYRGVLSKDGDPSGLDYLEKIIQIPYRTRAMGPEAARQFVLGHTTAIAAAQVPLTEGATTGGGPSQAASISGGASVDTGPSATAVARELTFSADEQQAMAVCCSLLELSPRAAKRVVNVCKLFRMVYARRGIAAPPLDQTALVAMLVGFAAAHPEVQRGVLSFLEHAAAAESATKSVSAVLRDYTKGAPPSTPLEKKWVQSMNRFQEKVSIGAAGSDTFAFGSEPVAGCIDTIRFVSAFCFVSEAS